MQIALVPGVIGMALLVGLAMMTGTWDNLQAPLSDLNSEPTMTDLSGFGAFGVFAILIFWTIVFWIVVSWHRYVLLEEMPQGWLPPFRADRILAYFGLILMLALITMVAMIPFGILLGIMAQSAPGLVVIGGFFYFIALVLCIYRLSVMLPASAIGQPITLATAWNKTERTFGTLIVLFIVSGIFQIIVQVIFGLLMAIPVIGLALVLIPSILILPLINVSILTTMYGIYVEGRDID
ncbi:hypothetical protein [Tropicibacter sp. Alg240-R139]|uniref:hypothetical protein n=1 Tax=Tropicibacter sp. Alg240-R139 TaxID=2305991 RepID=UPI0013DEAACB|nr:hypothetical protein [Tropicibacter sp. Alg240-R139]